MGRGPCTFRQRDVTVAARAAVKAGLAVQRIEIYKDKIVVVTDQTGGRRIGNVTDETENPWDQAEAELRQKGLQ